MISDKKLTLNHIYLADKEEKLKFTKFDAGSKEEKNLTQN